MPEADAILGLDHIAVVVSENLEARLHGLPPGRYVLAPRGNSQRRTEFEVAAGAGLVTVDLR